MDNLVLLVLTLSCVVYSQGWLYIVIGNKKLLEGHPNQCFYKGLGYMNANDEKSIPNECIKALCREDGSILFAGCGTHASERSCKMIKGDLTQDYPECCPHAICQ